MRRREFITLVGGVAAWPLAALWPIGALAEAPAKRPVVGLLVVGQKAAGARYYSAFLVGMRELGYLENRDYTFEERYADGDPARLPLLAEELVRLNADVIVTGNNAATLAARKETTTVPIVSVNLTDPLGFGFVVSEARPGNNITGLLTRVEGLAAKQLDVARDLMAAMSSVGLLVNPGNPTNVVQQREIELAAAKSGVKLVSAEVRTGADLGPAFQTFGRAGVDIVVVLADAMFLTVRRQIAAFALTTRLPTVFAWREHVEDGGLISYGTDLRERFRRTALFVSRILKGEKR